MRLKCFSRLGRIKMKIETIRIMNALIMLSAYVIEIISIIVWYIKCQILKNILKK